MMPTQRSVPHQLLCLPQTHAYEVHERFCSLRATSVLARLQLAALYAATGSLLPEPGSALTGAQLAMDLVRQCWTNRPLHNSELEQLESVGRLGRHMAAGLPLLTHELRAAAAQLNDLHFPYGVPDGTLPPVLGCDDGTAYLHESRGPRGGQPPPAADCL